MSMTELAELKRRGGGGLVQLVTFGCCDYESPFHNTCGAPMPCRRMFVHGSSVNRPTEYSFIERDAQPLPEDLVCTVSILAHVPDAQAPSRTDVTLPFRVRSEPHTACWEARVYTLDDV
jgi:hypothetical protein